MGTTHTHTLTQLPVESITVSHMVFLLAAFISSMLTERPALLSSCILLLLGVSSQRLTFLFTALYIVKIMYEVSLPKPLCCVVSYTSYVCMCVCVSLFVCMQLAWICRKKYLDTCLMYVASNNVCVCLCSDMQLIARQTLV